MSSRLAYNVSSSNGPRLVRYNDLGTGCARPGRAPGRDALKADRVLHFRSLLEFPFAEVVLDVSSVWGNQNDPRRE